MIIVSLVLTSLILVFLLRLKGLRCQSCNFLLTSLLNSFYLFLFTKFLLAEDFSICNSTLFFLNRVISLLCDSKAGVSLFRLVSAFLFIQLLVCLQRLDLSQLILLIVFSYFVQRTFASILLDLEKSWFSLVMIDSLLPLILSLLLLRKKTRFFCFLQL